MTRDSLSYPVGIGFIPNTLSFVAALTFAAALNAQTLPQPAQPGSLERQLQQPVEPKTTLEGATPALPDTIAPQGADKTPFLVQRIEVVGSTVYGSGDFAPYFDPYINKQITLAQLYQLAADLTAKYRNDGYVLSRVIVPAQKLQDGVARLTAIEGYIDKVEVTGAAISPRISAYMDKIIGTRPLHVKNLERYLLLTNDLPGVTANATLSPSQDAAGASTLTLEFQQKKIQARLSADNRGSKFIGRGIAQASLYLNSLLGRDDQTVLQYSQAAQVREWQYIALAHQEQWGTEGAKLDFLISKSKSRPGDVLAVFDPEGRTESFSVTSSYPMIRSRSKNLFVRGGFNYRNVESDFGSTVNFEDRIRALRLGATYDFADRFRGVNILDGELARGLDILNETPTGSRNLSREQGRSDFTKLSFYGARLQSLSAPWSVLTAFSGQYAFNPLLSSEEFGFGGAQFGRGYDPSELLGDSGLAAKLELRYTKFGISSLIQSITGYGFYDAGKVWRRLPSAGQQRTESATSAGIGVRFSALQRMNGFIELAKPISHVVEAEGNKKARVYFGVAASF